MIFSDWLLSLSDVVLRCLHLTLFDGLRSHFFVVPNPIYCVVWMYHRLPVRLLEGHRVCVGVSAVRTNLSKTPCAGFVPRAWLLNPAVRVPLALLRHCHTGFWNGCTVSPPHQQWMGISVLHTLACVWQCPCLDFGLSKRRAVASSCPHLRFPGDVWGGTSLHRTCLTSVHLLWWGVCEGLWPMVSLGFSFSYCFSFSYFKSYLQCWTTIRYQTCVICRYLFPTCGLSFSLLDSVFHRTSWF